MVVFSFIGFLGASFILIPFVEYLRLSFNRHTVVQHWALPVRSIVTIFFPFFMGFPGTWTKISVLRELPYISVVSLFTVFAVKKKQILKYFFGFWLVFFIFKAFALWPASLTVHIPIFNMVIFYKYGYNIFIFSIACLTAFAISNFNKAKIIEIKALVVFVSWVLLLLPFIYIFSPWINAHVVTYLKSNLFNTFSFLFLCLLILLFRNKRTYLYCLLALPSLAFFVIALLAINSISRTNFGKFPLYIFSLVLLITGIYLINKFPNKAAQIGIASLITVELLVYIPYDKPVRFYPYTPPNFVKKLQNLARYDRFISLNNNIRPNVGIAYGLYDARGLNALQVGRYIEYWRKISSHSDNHIIAYRGNTVLDHPLMNLLSVEYVLANTLENSAQPYGNKDFVKSKKYELPYKLDPSKIFSFSIDIPPAARYLRVHLKGEGEMRLSFFNKSAVYKVSEDRIAYFPIKDGRNVIRVNCLKGEVIIRALDFRFYPNSQSKFKLVKKGNPGIYRNTAALPRTFIVQELIREEKGWLRQIEKIDLKKQALVSGAKKKFLPVTGYSKIIKYGLDEVKIKAHTSNDSFLVLTDVFYPGWRCFIDGKPVKIFRTNYLFRGVNLPRGNHKIVFKYEPVSYKIGFILSALALILLITIWLLSNKERITKRLRGVS